MRKSIPFSAVAVLLATITASAWGRNPYLPDPARTPGAVDVSINQANIDSTICVPGYSRRVRPPLAYTELLKRKQIREYGYRDRRLSRYEEDHLVPLDIGGAPRDPRNLWPQPRRGRWTAKRKDLLEEIAQRLVCRGDVSLVTMQRHIAQNWIAAYREYVHR